MKTVAIIQARTGSTRLPGKVMKTLCGKTVLAHVIERVKACGRLDKVVVATTVLPADDVIAIEARRCGASCYRGSEYDVLGRFYLAAQGVHAELIVRITSDCPLFESSVLRQMLDYFHSLKASGKNVDYLSNTIVRSYPRGLDAEIFTFDALEKAFGEAQQPYEREHVTPYLYEHPDDFSIHSFRHHVDLSEHRWTLDTEEDWCLIQKIYDRFYQEGSMFSMDQVLHLLEERPEMMYINAHVEQKKLKG